METDIDGILVWGATKEEHNQRLKAVLQRCNDIHMTLNKGKMSFWIIESSTPGPYNQCRRVIPYQMSRSCDSRLPILLQFLIYVGLDIKVTCTIY